MTTKLDIPTLQQNIGLCFAYSRDIERFDEDQREGWLIQGENLRAHLVELEAAEFRPELDSNVQTANARLKVVKQQLQDTQKILNRYSALIKDLQILAGMLGGLLKFVTP